MSKKKTGNLTLLHKEGQTIIEDPFKAQRNVSFFLRIHGHLPDNVCGKSTLETLGPCQYREDGIPINRKNDYVDKLRKNVLYRNAEKEVLAAQEKGISIRKAP